MLKIYSFQIEIDLFIVSDVIILKKQCQEDSNFFPSIMENEAYLPLNRFQGSYHSTGSLLQEHPR